MPQQRRNDRDDRDDRDDRAARARAKRMAWWLAALAVFFYVGYFAWNFFRGD